MRNINGQVQKNGGNVAAYFTTPNGQVINATAGPVKPAVMLKEARWAVETWQSIKSSGRSSNALAAAHQSAVRSSNGNQAKVHQLLAAKPLAPLGDIYPTVFENILGEEVANSGVNLTLAKQGLEMAAREGVPMLFILHRREDNRKAISEWNLKLARAGAQENHPLPVLARSFVTIALPMEEMPALSAELGVDPYVAPDGGSPLFVVAGQDGKQLDAMTGWHRDGELVRAMAAGIVEEARKQELTLPRLQALLKLVEPIDERMTLRVNGLIQETRARNPQQKSPRSTYGSSRRSGDRTTTKPATKPVTKPAAKPATKPTPKSIPSNGAAVASLTTVSSKSPLANPGNVGVFSVQDDIVALSLPSAPFGVEAERVLVTVPRVMGLPYKKAKQMLESAGLSVEVRNAAAQDSDLVMRQSVRYGTEVEQGTTVRLDKLMASVPDVVGLPLEEARELLAKRYGFTGEYDESLAGDLAVTEQSPAAGSNLERGETITLLSRKRIPSVIGMEVSEVVKMLKDAGIPLRLDSATINGDTVFRQVPAPGEWLNGKDSASLTAGVMVPDLRGSLNSAKSTLRHLGVVGEVAGSRTARSSRPPFPHGQESVYRQSLKPGDWMTRTQILKVYTVRYVPASGY